MSRQGSLSIERMCQLVPVSRASFYRSLQEHRPVEEEMAVRSTIQQIAVEHRRRYGYRRIAAELRLIRRDSVFTLYFGGCTPLLHAESRVHGIRVLSDILFWVLPLPHHTFVPVPSLF